MRLVLAYPPKLLDVKELCQLVVRYFPRLMTELRLVESSRLVGYFRAEDIVQSVESLLQPNWEEEVILFALYGPIYAYGELPIEDCAATFQEFEAGKRHSLPPVPKVGGYYNLRAIERLGLLKDTKFLAKVAAEEILHIFDLPKEHDPLCFFHPRDWLDKTSHENEYCQKCLALMRSLTGPLNYEEVYRFMDELYGFQAKQDAIGIPGPEQPKAR